MLTILTKAVDYIINNKFLAETETKLLDQYDQLTKQAKPVVQPVVPEVSDIEDIEEEPTEKIIKKV
jgi:hypothetical protein